MSRLIPRFGLAFVMASLPLVAKPGGMPNVVPSYMKDAPSSSASEPWNPAFSMAYLEGATPKDGSEMFAFGVEQDAPNLSDTSFYFRQSEQDDHRIERLRILIDNNVQPLVAEFRFGPKMGRIDLLGQVCLEKFSPVRAVATVADGSHFAAGRYIESSQVCRSLKGNPSETGAAEILVSFLDLDTPVGGMRSARLKFATPTDLQELTNQSKGTCRVYAMIDETLLFDMLGESNSVCGKSIGFNFVSSAGKTLTISAEFGGDVAVERVIALDDTN